MKKSKVSRRLRGKRKSSDGSQMEVETREDESTRENAMDHDEDGDTHMEDAKNAQKEDSEQENETNMIEDNGQNVRLGEHGMNREDDDQENEELGEIEEESSAAPIAATERSEFLDAFYGLASTDPRERAVAGQTILHHSLLSESQANVADASYAFRRLLNGICSGRAAARQGNASCLASFLKVSRATGVLHAIQQEQQKNDGAEDTGSVSLLAFVRNRLVQVTSLDNDDGNNSSNNNNNNNSGRRKAAEIKDHNFGRLFGILAIVRSGILSPSNMDSERGDDRENQDQNILVTSKGFISDLHELYNFKPYMREPSAHAVCTLLNFFYRMAHKGNGGNKNTSQSAAKIVSQLVRQSVVPLFLQKGDNDDKEKQDITAKRKKSLASRMTFFSAEQVAIVWNIQSHSCHMDLVVEDTTESDPLNDIVWTTNLISSISTALASTCTVKQPRTHLVWDTLWLYLTESFTSDQQQAIMVDKRKMRSQLVNNQRSSNNAEDPQVLLRAVVDQILIRKLLAVKEGDMSTIQDQRMLAMALIRFMAGIEFVSSLSGRTSLDMDVETFRSIVMHPDVVRLFLDTLSANKKKHQGDSEFKATAATCLNEIVESLNGNYGVRLAMVKALVCVDPRFDGRTRTSTVHDLLGMKDTNVTTEQQKMWKDFASFLQDRILKVTKGSKDNEITKSADTISSKVLLSEAVGLSDLLLNIAKRILRIGAELNNRDEERSEEKIEEKDSSVLFRDAMLKEIMSFVLAISFVQGNALKQKSTIKKNQNDKSFSKAVEVAETVNRTGGTIPYETRKLLSVRFFSVLTDYVNAVAHLSLSRKKETAMFEVVSYVMEECRHLEQRGYLLFFHEERIEDDDDDGPSCQTIVTELNGKCQELIKNSKDTPNLCDRFLISVGLLVSFLQLCLLRCNDGTLDPAEQDIDEMADHEDVQEIQSLIQETKSCADKILGKKDDVNEDESNPLALLVTLAINLLSSSFGEASDCARGASTRLTRDLTKVVLSAGIMYIAKSTDSESYLNGEIAEMMLDSIGAGTAEFEEEEEEGDEVEDVSNNDDDDSNNDDDDDNDSKDDNDSENRDSNDANKNGNSPKVNPEKVQNKSKKNADSGEKMDESEDGDEVVIGNDQLNSLLEESDLEDVESTLEHHEGADAALVKMIKLKQEARKAGEAARERVELSRQTRCMLVLELLVSGKPDGWGSLLRADILMSMVAPLLDRWGHLDKANSRNGGKSADAMSGERNALLSRLSAFVKSKLLKSKMGNLAWSPSHEKEEVKKEHLNAVASRVIEQARRRVSKEHEACCYHSLPTLFRALPNSIDFAAKVYSDCIQEWSTKKSTKLDARMFDELIQSTPPLAQAILVDPLVKAAIEARSAFLKSECFRLISNLYNPKLNKGEHDEEKDALETLVRSRDGFVHAFTTVLQDKDMQKPKRLKELLRCAEKVVGFTSTYEAANQPISSDALKKLKTSLEVMATGTNSNATQKLGDSLISKLEALLRNENAKERSSTSASSTTTTTTNSKKKKKKRK